MQACKARSGSTVRLSTPFSTSTRVWQEQQSSAPTDQSKTALNVSKGEEDDDEGKLKTMPSPPFGGRFGVPDQPMNTKQIEQLKQQQQQQGRAGGKSRSPFTRAKEDMKHKVHDWTDQEKNLQKRKEL